MYVITLTYVFFVVYTSDSKQITYKHKLFLFFSEPIRTFLACNDF